jgi:hypothetical protein
MAFEFSTIGLPVPGPEAVTANQDPHKTAG